MLKKQLGNLKRFSESDYFLHFYQRQRAIMQGLMPISAIDYVCDKKMPHNQMGLASSYLW